MKARFIFAILALLSIIVISSWFLYRDDLNLAIRPGDAGIPDYTLEDFLYTSYDLQGLQNYRIRGKHLQHYPNTKSLLIEDASFTAYAQNRVNWDATASKARIHETQQSAYLSGGTLVQYFAGGRTTPITMRTESMSIYTKRDHAEGKQATEFRFPDGSLHAQGGFAIDGPSHTLHLYGGVKGELVHD